MILHVAYYRDLAQDGVVAMKPLLCVENLGKIRPRKSHTGGQTPWWKLSLQAPGEVAVSLCHIVNKRGFELLQSPLQQKKTNSHIIRVSVSLPISCLNASTPAMFSRDQNSPGQSISCNALTPMFDIYTHVSPHNHTEVQTG